MSLAPAQNLPYPPAKSLPAGNAFSHGNAFAVGNAWTEDRTLLERVRVFLLWVMMAGSSLVIAEPAPYELLAVVTIGFFVLSGGMRIGAQHLVLFTLLVIYCLGLSLSGLMVIDKPKVATWLGISWYLAVTALFFAVIPAHNLVARFDAMMRGWIIAALLCSVLGILAYFHLIPGYSLFLRYERLKGTFNDPNVTGPFLTVALLVLVQQFFIGSARQMLKAAVPAGIIMLALLLTFSRGAWIHFFVSIGVMVVLLFATSTRNTTRARIVLIILGGCVLLAVLIGMALSLSGIGDMLVQRASLNQSYDVGPMGRFGRHILGLQLALGSPLGIGPLQFGSIFPEDTHNVYLNSFMAGGWTAGIAYLTLTLMTLMVGLRASLQRVPWQPGVIMVFSAYVGLVVEGSIIDSEHWRHYWVLVGLLWGLLAANRTALKRA